ncbi:MAG: Mur ligase family protein, partial [Elusimicrobiales bacterium]|nr:Mur ligase family protein [Elusimicrobiales bacterium]
MFRYDGRNALILGAGRSGVAAAELLLERHSRATIVDEHWTPEYRADVGSRGIRCLTAEATHLPDGNYDLLVASPAIPADHPWLTLAHKRGLAIISEMELGAHYWQGQAIAVTGSKGKSSVVKCLADTLNLAGHPAVTAGNYGTPLSQRVLECPDMGRDTIAVVEVSSFQMEHTRTFAPHLAAILTI